MPAAQQCSWAGWHDAPRCRGVVSIGCGQHMGVATCAQGAWSAARHPGMLWWHVYHQVSLLVEMAGRPDECRRSTWQHNAALDPLASMVCGSCATVLSARQHSNGRGGGGKTAQQWQGRRGEDSTAMAGEEGGRQHSNGKGGGGKTAQQWQGRISNDRGPRMGIYLDIFIIFEEVQRHSFEVIVFWVILHHRQLMAQDVMYMRS